MKAAIHEAWNKRRVTPKPSHSKVVISDTGKVFITTCNLLSGSMNSGVLEAGLLIQDWRCALSTLDALFEDGCIPSEIEKEARILRQSLNDAQESRQSTAHNKNLINDKLKEINNDIDHQRLNFAIVKFQRLLADLAERPVWSLIRTSHHRPLLEDCISKFRTRLVLASDGLRKNGLDKSMIDAISTTAAGTGGTLHVWWGRHAPFSKPIDEADERGRKDAASQLNQLRKMLLQRIGEFVHHSRINPWSHTLNCSWLKTRGLSSPPTTHSHLAIPCLSAAMLRSWEYCWTIQG